MDDSLLVTQKIDGLHHRAGSRNILELHGTLRRTRCFDCRQYFEWPSPAGDPVCSSCGGMLRPDVVMFEEELPPGAMDTALARARECDVLLSVGTSNVVWPAAEIPHVAMRAGATVIVVNPDLEGEPRGRTAIGLAGSAGTLMPRLFNSAFFIPARLAPRSTASTPIQDPARSCIHAPAAGRRSACPRSGDRRAPR